MGSDLLSNRIWHGIDQSVDLIPHRFGIKPSCQPFETLSSPSVSPTEVRNRILEKRHIKARAMLEGFGEFNNAMARIQSRTRLQREATLRYCGSVNIYCYVFVAFELLRATCKLPLCVTSKMTVNSFD